MNKLEQQIFDILYQELEDDSSEQEIAQKLAKIALELAEKAFKEGVIHGCDPEAGEDSEAFDQFKQEIL